MPGSDLALLVEAAAEAGGIALRFWRQGPEAWDKGGGAGPVSEADLAVNRMLEAELRAARPEYGWLSEESPDDPAARMAAERCFVLDPIDGTRAFLAGEKDFSHSLAVVEHGRPVAAVVHLPARELTYAAEAGEAATLNGQAIRVRVPRGRPEMLGTRASLGEDLWPGGVPDLRRSFRASLAWRLCLVAEGRFDAMLTLRDTWEWDVAAGALIAERAGGRVSDGLGRPLVFNRPDPRLPGVICAGPELWADLAARRGGAAHRA